jgi:hypothetical protein
LTQTVSSIQQQRFVALEQAQLSRLRNSGRAIAYVKLSKNAVQVSFRGAHRDRQLICDLLIAAPTTHSPKDLGFSRAQCFMVHDGALTLLPKSGRVVCL